MSPQNKTNLSTSYFVQILNKNVHRESGAFEGQASIQAVCAGKRVFPYHEKQVEDMYRAAQEVWLSRY